MTPAKTKQQAERDARRQTLLEAARDLFAHKGYHATTVDDITRAAGVAKGTFYLYFGEKREIYCEVIRGFLDMVKEIGGVVGANPRDPAEFFARAESAAKQLMAIFVENRELARLAYRESMGLDRELEAMVSKFYRDIAEVEARNIETAIALGMVRPVRNPLLVAYAHIGMVERVLLTMADAPDEFPDTSQIVAEMMQLAFEGLRKP